MLSHRRIVCRSIAHIAYRVDVLASRQEKFDDRDVATQRRDMYQPVSVRRSIGRRVNRRGRVFALIIDQVAVGSLQGRDLLGG